MRGVSWEIIQLDIVYLIFVHEISGDMAAMAIQNKNPGLKRVLRSAFGKKNLFQSA